MTRPVNARRKGKRTLPCRNCGRITDHVNAGYSMQCGSCGHKGHKR